MTTALVAGLELDELIAEKVMGDERGDFGTNADGHRHFTWRHGNSVSERPPYYSADIACAWKVVEKLHNEYVEFFVQADAEWEGEEWAARFGWPPPDKDHPMHHGETMALAICRAALARAGVS